MSNIKTRLQRLTDARKMSKESEIICARRSGEKESIRWLDAIRRDPSIDHFEDAPGFKLCSELPNAILGVTT